MSKTQMIEAIRQRNRSAKEDFLVHFDEQALQSYLRRLDLNGHRGRQSVWIREGGSACVATRGE